MNACVCGRIQQEGIVYMQVERRHVHVAESNKKE
jgi:hypothetical protein